MSISHFSDLSKKRQQIFIDNTEDFTVEEKIDGSNFRFKLDFEFPWACRKTSNGAVYHTPDDWGTDMWVTGFRVAHQLMSNSLAHFKDFVHIGELYPFGSTLNTELLFVDSPNTLIYGTETSAIIIYEPYRDSSFCMHIPVQLDNVPYTIDGHDIKYEKKSYEFVVMNNRKAEPLINDLQIAKTGIKFDAESIEEYLMKHWVQNYHSEYTMDRVQTRAEGLVFKHKDGWCFKLVDREWFTKKNKENYVLRNTLFKSPRGVRSSFMDRFWNDVKSGSDAKTVATSYLNELDDILVDYWTNQYSKYDSHIHLANLRALASIRKQMNDIEKNGISNE